MNRRNISALPTTMKYLATGTADSSLELSKSGQPIAATLVYIPIARQIE
jgi:hypothetical protein